MEEERVQCQRLKGVVQESIGVQEARESRAISETEAWCKWTAARLIQTATANAGALAGSH